MGTGLQGGHQIQKRQDGLRTSLIVCQEFLDHLVTHKEFSLNLIMYIIINIRTKLT